MLDETKGETAGRLLTVRERMEEHRKNPQCTSCHRVIDPLGLALENFDVTGKYRIKDAGMPVDPSGVLYDGTPMSGPAGLRAALLKHQDVVLLSFTEHLMTYALGRRIDAADMWAVRRVIRDAEKRNLKISSFVQGVATSPLFTMGRATERVNDRRRAIIAEGGTFGAAGADMNVITGKHLHRRTVLKGIGATVALPFLDAMMPAGVSAQTRKVRLVAMEMVHGSAGSTAFGLSKNLWAPAATGSAFDLSVTALSPLEPWREYLTIVSNTDVRMAEAFAPPEIGGDHFRSAAVFLTQSHPKQTQGSDLQGRHLARPAVRAEVRAGDADSLDAAVRRERRPGRRLLLRVFLRVYRLDQLGQRGRSAADDSRPARGVRSAVRHRRHARGARRSPQPQSQHPRLGHRSPPTG